MWSYDLDLRSITLTVVKVVKELVITVYLLKCLIIFWIVVTKYLIFLQAVRDF